MRAKTDVAVWPNFYIVGAAKCGTTSLWSHLRKHPHVFLPVMKETQFFADALVPVPPEAADMHCPGDLDKFQDLFRDAGEYTAIGDASPAHLWDEGAPRKIREVCPQARIIVMLRDPVDRAYSQYLMNVYSGNEKLPALQALQHDYYREQKGWWSSRLYVELGLYYEQIKRYLEVFDSEQVAVLMFDDLKRDPVGLFSNVAEHIGVDPHLLNAADVSRPEHAYKEARFPLAHKLAKSAMSRQLRKKILPEFVSAWLRQNNILYQTKKPPQDAESKRFLQQFYEPDLKKLEDLLGRKLPELRKSWI